MGVFCASIAFTKEGELALRNGSLGQTGSLLGKNMGHLNFMQIQDPTAEGTNEVDMGLDVAVKPFHPIDIAQTLDQPLLFEQRQVPIDSAQGNVRNFRFDPGVDHLSGGMSIGGAEIG